MLLKLVRLYLPVLVVCVGGLLPVNGRSETLTEAKVKSAYILNFTKFVKWPAQEFATDTAPIEICTRQEKPLSGTLQDTIADKTANGRPLLLRSIGNGRELRGCQVLFLSEKDAGQFDKLPAQAWNGVLTVSDSEYQAHSQVGAVITFVLDEGRMRFAIDRQAADKAGLSISSKLLSLAQSVKQ